VDAYWLGLTPDCSLLSAAISPAGQLAGGMQLLLSNGRPERGARTLGPRRGARACQRWSWNRLVIISSVPGCLNARICAVRSGVAQRSEQYVEVVSRRCTSDMFHDFLVDVLHEFPAAKPRSAKGSVFT
jgi:hypothetical protein